MTDCRPGLSPARVFWVALLLCPCISAQVTMGVFAGVVRDASGGAVPDSDIIIENLATGAHTTAHSNAEGYYLSVPLAPGQYTLRVSHPGFSTVVREHISLEVNQRAVVDFELHVGQVNESLTVSGSAPLLQAESSALSNMRTEKEVEELPLNGRNFNQLIYLSAGVVPSTDQRTGGAPKIAQRGFTGHSTNGLGHEQNNFLLEGIDNQEDNNGLGLLFYPNVDAIQEFKVQTSVSTAEFGRGGGGVINMVLKSGGRDLHGNAFEFLRNAVLDAKNFFDPKNAPIPSYIRNQFGGTIGGPVVIPGLYNTDRSKTFFFFDYEGLALSQGQTYLATVPVSAFRDGDFSGSPIRIFDPRTTRLNPAGSGSIRDPFPGNRIPASSIDPVGRNLVSLYPLPNLFGFIQNYSSNPKLIQNGHGLDVKIDHHPALRENITFRFSESNARITTPGVLPAPAVGGGGNAGVTHNPAEQMVLSWTHAFSPNKINESRFGFTRWNLQAVVINSGRSLDTEVGIPGVNNPKDPFTSGLSTLNVSGFQGLGDEPTSPLQNAFNHFQWDDTFSYYRGRHGLKLGAHLIRRQFNGFQATGLLGIFGFTGIYTTNLAQPAGTGSGLADLLLGKPQSGQKVILNGSRGLRRTEVAGFLQDDYRITSRLTLNLGLRYDLFDPWPWNEVNKRMANFNPSLGDIFVVGTPQMPSHSGTNIDWWDFGPRAGFAYQLPGKLVLRSAYGIFYSANPQAQNFAISLNPPFVGSFQFTNDQADFDGARPLSAGFESPTVFPTRGANLNAVQMNGLRMPYTQQWNFTLEQALPGDIVLTTGYVGTKGTHLLSWGNLNQPRPGPRAVAPRRPFPLFGNISIWEPRNNSEYNGLHVMAEKRLAHGIQFLASYTYSHGLTDIQNWSSAPQDYLNFARDRGNSYLDVRHRFVGSWTWEIPVGRHQRFLSSMGRFANTIAGGWQLNGITTLSRGIPFTVNSSINTLNGSGMQRADRVGNGNLSNPTLARYFDLSAFAVPAPFAFGTSARNVLYGPGTAQVDFSLFKRFALGAEGRYIQFRSEFFNLFNTPQFNNPSGCTDAAQGCGAITSAGSPSTLQRTSRQIQFALKLYF